MLTMVVGRNATLSVLQDEAHIRTCYTSVISGRKAPALPHIVRYICADEQPVTMFVTCTWPLMPLPQGTRLTAVQRQHQS
jgi:methylthioribose-1-phosphate isomerase